MDIQRLEIDIPKRRYLAGLSQEKMFEPEKEEYFWLLRMVNKACTWLGVEEPKIIIAPFLADSPYSGQVSMSPQTLLDKSFKFEYLVGGMAFPNSDAIMPNTIVLAYYDPYTVRPLMEEELTFNVLHEIRHFWQYKHHRRIYYNGQNARGDEEHRVDNSEADADAFALAYLMIQKRKGFRTVFNEIPISAKVHFATDEGRRITRVREILKKEFNYSVDNEKPYAFTLKFKHRYRLLWW